MEDRTFAQALEDARPRFEMLQAHVTGILDQIMAAWREIEPVLRDAVAAGDSLTEQEWSDLSESARAEYVRVKAILSTYDQEMQALQPTEE